MIMPLECMYSVPPSQSTLIPPPPLFRNNENNSIIDHQPRSSESIMENNRMVENSFNLNQIKWKPKKKKQQQGFCKNFCKFI